MKDPVSLIIGSVLSRVLDKKKPLSKTNVATAGGAGFGVAAYTLIQTGEPTMVALGYGLGLVGTLLALYKEKNK